jgi:methionine synthase / methylenetetrahydrofolate reductase(NADPH)
MTQVLFDLEPLEAMLDRLGGASPIPLLVGLWPITSHALALRLHNEVPGITLPDAVMERFAAAEAQAAREGVAVARELLAEARELVAGVYLVAPFGQPRSVLSVLV